MSETSAKAELKHKPFFDCFGEHGEHYAFSLASFCMAMHFCNLHCYDTFSKSITTVQLPAVPTFSRLV